MEEEEIGQLFLACCVSCLRRPQLCYWYNYQQGWRSADHRQYGFSIFTDACGPPESRLDPGHAAIYVNRQ